jgi:zinc protease
LEIRAEIPGATTPFRGIVMRFVPLALALTLSAAAQGQQDLPIRDTVLANGLHVIVVENHAVPLVTVELDVRNGSFTEPPEYNGLSHLYEHMFFKANRSIPSQEKYLQRLRQLGGSWNGTTSEERVNYFVTVRTDSVRPTMQFMEDAIRYPLFQQEELVRERPVVTGEFDRNESNPFFHLVRGADTLLWGKEYYSRKNVIGNRDMILTATTEKMKTIQNRYYVPNNSALILSGDISPARGFRLATEIFGDWARGADPFATPAPDPPPLARSQAAIVEQPVNATTILMSWQGPSVTRDPAATYAADVLSTILNNRTSPFQKRLVDSGIAFAAQLSYYTLSHVGPIQVFLQTAPQKTLEAQRVALEEIAKFVDSTYVSQAQLEAAQKQLGIQALYEREQASNWAHTIGFWWSVAGLDYYRTYVPNMQKVTRGDLARYAQTYLQNKPFVTSVLINPDARKQINLTNDQLLPKPVVP